MKGSPVLHECDYGCGKGYDGCIQIICNNIKFDDNSRIESTQQRYRYRINKEESRVVINIKDDKLKQLCLVYCFIKRFSMGICNLLFLCIQKNDTESVVLILYFMTCLFALYCV